jgi:hypothetical protein
LSVLVGNYPDEHDHKENAMSDAALNSPQLTREDRYFKALEEFLRTSAGYLDVDVRMPGQGISRNRHERTVHSDELR